jgi:hypothetical protein
MGIDNRPEIGNGACKRERGANAAAHVMGADFGRCHFLDNLTEEMEVAAEASVYDDYTFVTREELESLQMETLVGTTMLRPYMHGMHVVGIKYARFCRVLDAS